MEITKLYQELKKKPNVVGVSGDILPKIREGKEVATEAVRVYVSKKLPKDCLSPKDLVPEKIKVKGKEVVTDVVEIGVLKAQSDPKLKHRPIKPGISSMNYVGSACTMNAFFKDKETGEIYVASNNHCYAMTNTAPLGSKILQPSPYDGGSIENDVIGTLEKYVEIKFNSFSCPYRETLHKLYRVLTKADQTNKVDIAFAKIAEGVTYSTTMCNGPCIAGKYNPKVGDIAFKNGRTTGPTEGTVIDTKFTGSVQYDRGLAMFTDCILISGNKFSQGGDSGSAVVVGDKYIGALFAGSDTVTIVCKVDNIEKEAGVELYTAN